MTNEQLKGIAAAALNLAKRDMEQGDFNFLVAAYIESNVPPLFRLREAEAFVVEKLGEDWLNHGRTKDIGFSVFRKCMDLDPPEALVFVTVANGFDATEKFFELSMAKQQELMEAGYDRHHAAVKEGLFTVEDVLTAVAQTPERVCQYVQPLKREAAPKIHFASQADFGGRMKMFGVEDEEQRGVAGRIDLGIEIEAV